MAGGSANLPRVQRGMLIAWLLSGALCSAQVDPGPSPARETGTWKFGAFFWHESPNDEVALDGVRAALAARGHPFDLIVRSAGGDADRAAQILAEMREESLDLVFAMGTQAALLCKDAFGQVPVVYTAVTNPVESGVVTSWTGSGRRLAGNSNWLPPETILRVFRLAVPNLGRLGVLRSERGDVVSGAELRSVRKALDREGAPKIELVEEIVDGPDGIAPAVERLARRGVEAIWIPIDYVVYESIDRVLAAARPHHLPLVSSSLRGARQGAVAGVVVDYELLGERAVLIALDILDHGTDPGTIPVGTMQGYRVVVNLAAATRCGYELPLSLLAVADVILEYGDGPEPGTGGGIGVERR